MLSTHIPLPSPKILQRKLKSDPHKLMFTFRIQTNEQVSENNARFHLLQIQIVNGDQILLVTVNYKFKLITSAKQAAKALLAKVPAKEISNTNSN